MTTTGILEEFSVSEQAAAALGIGYIVFIIIAVVACFLLAIIPSKIAKKKGYSGAGFYWFGVAALAPAIIVACVLKNRNAAPAQQPQDPNQPQQ